MHSLLASENDTPPPVAKMERATVLARAPTSRLCQEIANGRVARDPLPEKSLVLNWKIPR